MSTESQVDLYPCPFCGRSQTEGFEHEEDCFFKLSEKLKASNGQDVVLAQKVANAWKRRAVPQGYKLVPAQIYQGYAADWGSKYHHKTAEPAAVELQDLMAGYADFVKALASPWKNEAS